MSCLAACVGQQSVGRPTIHIIWRVPSSDEAKVDKYWKSHEQWMRKSHNFGLEGDDSSNPRLLKFYIAKGKELNKYTCRMAPSRHPLKHRRARGTCAHPVPQTHYSA